MPVELRASALTGITVKQMFFEELLRTSLGKQYDAIWCCASLLHISRDILPSVLAALLNTLEPGGVMYLSFKHREADRTKDGRWFTDLTEESLERLFPSTVQCKLLESWITDDQRPGRSDTWLNAIIKRSAL